MRMIERDDGAGFASKRSLNFAEEVLLPTKRPRRVPRAFETWSNSARSSL